MKTIYIRNLVKNFLKKKKLIVICLILFVLVFGYLGFRRAYPEKVSSSLSEEVAEYEETLQEYDDAIAQIEENIATAEEQVEAQQEYCDNSIYIQIDPDEVQLSTVQYIIQVDEEDMDKKSTLISNILSTLSAYINNGGNMKAALAEKLPDMDTNYLPELIACGTNGNTFSVSVKHYDMDDAAAILAAVVTVMEEYKPTVEKEVGAFAMTVLGTSEMVYADSGVLSTQNTNLTNLRTYKTNLSDLKTKLASQKTTRSNYASEYAPSGTTDSPKKTLLEYGAMGIIAGIIVPFALYAVYYTLSGRVKGKEELLAGGLQVLAVYHPKKGYMPPLEKAAVNLALQLQRAGRNGLSLCAAGESPSLVQAKEDLEKLLKEQNIDVFAGRQGQEDAAQLQKIIESGSQVLFVEAGQTTYTQVEEQVQFCRSFDIEIRGCVVIE